MRLFGLCLVLGAAWHLSCCSAEGNLQKKQQLQQQQSPLKLCTTSPVAVEPPEDYPWRYLVLITQGRSGSTLVQRLINMLPGYFLNGENSNTFLDLLRIRLRLSKAHHATGDSAPEHAAGKHLPSMGTMDGAIRPLIDTFLSPKDCDARTIGFKEIRIWLNNQYDETASLVEQFMELEPRTAIVFVTRDTAQLVRSGWWKAQKPENVARQLNGQRSLFRRFHEEHPTNTYWITYEDTVNKTDAFYGLFTFLGTSFPQKAYEIAASANPK